MKRFLVAGGLIVACLLLGAEARAQGTGTARGKVLDDKGQPIEGAAILLEYQGGVTRKQTTKTNKKGEYTQVGLPPGIYRITATKDGYQGGYIDVRIALGDATYLPDLKLASAAAARRARPAARTRRRRTRSCASWSRTRRPSPRTKKYDEAIAAFQAVLARNVASPEEVHFRIGQLQAEKKDWPAAEASFLKALEIKPGHAGVTLELANVYQASGQKEKAAELMAKAQGAGEGDANIQYSTGVLHINAGRQEEAAAAFKKAIAIDPNHAESYYHLGTIALNQNNIPEAIANLEKYLSLNPPNAQNVATAQALIKALKPAK